MTLVHYLPLSATEEKMSMLCNVFLYMIKHILYRAVAFYLAEMFSYNKALGLH